jgi:chondroitin sulfate synthase
MNLFHKPRTCNGKNGLVNGINKSTKSANNKKYTGVWKFIVGILLGLLLGSQLQSLLISSSFCVPNKTSVFPIHQRQLKVRSEPLTVERTVETSSKLLVSHLKLKQLLLVGVMTADKYIATRAKAVYETWGKQVPGKILFFTADTQNVTDMDLPVVRLKGVDDSYPPQKKSFMMLKYMYENYGDKFEWFMRADDDVFVRTERLGLFLKNVNSSKASFIGQAGKGILVRSSSF